MDQKRYEIAELDEAYPQTLLELEKPPELLHVIGDPAALKLPSLAVIGARRATPYGLAVAERAGRIAAECGIALVSGGAMGCDAAALRAAQRAGGVTIVVSGTGADRVYPQTSRDGFEGAPKGGGCVVSL
ncbi:MAG: DNA-processing protein DprA, partial [Atopobiaceae bacterium]|nr:DNA-processing protein DprA [Atopobiaceae bacterium]